MNSTSLKIKISIPKPSTEPTTKAASRKATKRRILTSDDDDDDDDNSDSAASPSGGSSHHKPPQKKPRLSYTDDGEPELDTPSPRLQPFKPTATKPRVAAGTSKGPPKKKTRIVSDDDDEGDEFVPEPEERPAVATKPKMRDSKGKAKAAGGTGGKITARNESKPAETPAPSSTVVGKKRSRHEDDEDANIDIDITTVAAPSSSVPPSVPDVDPPKKKLPPIKKKSKTDSAATSAFVSPAPAPAPKAPVNAAKPAPGATAAKPVPPAAAGLPKKPQGPVQATTMNPSGTGDFDLRDSNIWQSLIGKGTSSSGPRVGIEKRVSTEERRKQLDKMRDEARAQREEQHRHTFDLQAQSQKISAFERKFGSHNIRIHGPHVLGAAFKVRPIPSRSQPAGYRH